MAYAAQLPRSGPAREALRERGQFFTPAWLAEPMVSYARRHATALFDPGFGAGAFAKAAIAVGAFPALGYAGCEPDASALSQAVTDGVPPDVLRRVSSDDFLTLSQVPDGTSFVANPPYIRHHRLGLDRKRDLQAMATRVLGKALDGRTGFHAFFLLHALTLLPRRQRLAFVVPSDICEGVYAPALWAWIGSRFRISGLVTFSSAATPFPGVDTNAVVLLLEHASPVESYPLVHVTPETKAELRDWVEADCPTMWDGCLSVAACDVKAALVRGVSRRPINRTDQSQLSLGDVVQVMRGIATGANEFFFLTSRDIAAHGLEAAPFIRAIGRTRDVAGDVVLPENLIALDRAHRPTYLLNLSADDPTVANPSLAAYLKHGAAANLPDRALIKQRRPWYKMERRLPPDFLFAYLGRRNVRFLWNQAGIVPLTSFLCVYPRPWLAKVPREALFAFLNHPLTVEGIASVAKSYGGGAIKVEPRALERAPISASLLAEFPWLDQQHRQPEPNLELVLT